MNLVNCCKVIVWWVYLMVLIPLLACQENQGHDASEEEETPEKQALLIGLQGKHPLSSISGFSGANTMYDYL